VVSYLQAERWKSSAFPATRPNRRDLRSVNAHSYRRISEKRIAVNSLVSCRLVEKSGPRLRANRKQQAILLKLLREFRSAAGITQAEMADLLKRPQSFVSKYESGDRRLDLLELRQVCRAMGVSTSEFVRRFEKTVDRESRQK
jgi:ribosome-binding protein aMBF1 (putative translation factor)